MGKSAQTSAECKTNRLAVSPVTDKLEHLEVEMSGDLITLINLMGLINFGNRLSSRFHLNHMPFFSGRIILLLVGKNQLYAKLNLEPSTSQIACTSRTIYIFYGVNCQYIQRTDLHGGNVSCCRIYSTSK